MLVPLLAYPLASLADGAPRFPTRAECVREPVAGQPVAVVWGRFDGLAEAEAHRERVVGVGFVGTEVLADGCGLWKVVLGGVPSEEIAREIQAEAAGVDLRPTLELDSGG